MRTFCIIVSILSLLPLGGCGDDDGDNTLLIACVRSAACGVQAYSNVSNCADGYATLAIPQGRGPVMEAIFSCVAGAGSCAAVKTCYGEGTTCDSAYKATCAGGKAQYCDLISHLTYVYNCGGAGLTCQVDKKNAFAATCTGPATSPGLATSASCGGGVCKSTGESCDGNTYDGCSSGKLKACLNKEWVLFDCKALGLGACYTSSSNNTSSCGLPL